LFRFINILKKVKFLRIIGGRYESKETKESEESRV